MSVWARGRGKRPGIYVGRTFLVLLLVLGPSAALAVYLERRFADGLLEILVVGVAVMLPAGTFISLLLSKTERGEWKWFIEPSGDADVDESSGGYWDLGRIRWRGEIAASFAFLVIGNNEKALSSQ